MSGRPGEKLYQAFAARLDIISVGVVKSIDWSDMTARVEFKALKGLETVGRIKAYSGTNGTFYPPIAVGDLVEIRVSNADLTELLEDKTAKKGLRNKQPFDASDVIVDPSPYADSGEPSGRLSSDPPGDGEMLIHHKSGTEIRIEDTGDVVVKLASGRKGYFNSKTGAKAILRDGDSNGGGAVGASQTEWFIGDTV